MRWRGLLLALLLSLLPSAALAHVPDGGAGSVMAGLLHPVTGIDHVVAMVAVGLWGAVLGAPAIWLLPVAFPMVMAFGGLMGLLDLPLPGVETGIALSALVLALLPVARITNRPCRSACTGADSLALRYATAP